MHSHRNSEASLVERLHSQPAATTSSSGNSHRGFGPDEYFHSRRVKKRDVCQPWTTEPTDPKEKWIAIIPLLGMLIGMGIGGVLVWNGWTSVINHKYCLVYKDDFSNGLDRNIWQPEVQCGGFGNHEFEESTDSEENLFVQDGILNIKATLQDKSLINEDYVLDLTATGSGTCTSQNPSDCIAETNVTAGNSSIIPPVRSARINTKGTVSVTYGRVEVTAKLPEGDWLWPAIWMMPVEDTYGPWPASGEIDIVESRGNDHTYKQGGNDIVSSALHWGPDVRHDAWWRTFKKRATRRGATYASKFSTFALEWSDKYLFTFIDNRLMQTFYVPFSKPLWEAGGFATATDVNGTLFADPWSKTGRVSTPFDRPFYLILSLAVGGTNGWFEDGLSNKPWSDSSPSAMKDFWEARDTWYETWKQPAMQISSVKIYKQCDDDGGNGEL